MAGAKLGYAPLWIAWLSVPMMIAVQFICAKIGMVSGMGVAGVLRRHYPRWLLYVAVLALVVANTINAGADIIAIAAGINLLVPVPIGFMVLPIAVLILVVQVWGSYRLIASIFKWLTLSLFAYIGAAFLAKPDWGAVLAQTFLPTLHFDNTFLTMVVALLGTNISPYLFFWQASQEVEEQISRGRILLRQRKGATVDELKNGLWDVITGMVLSNVVMYFIILATAATLHQAGQTEVATADQAAQALRPLAGEGAYLLMALGLIGSGLLAVPTLTGSAAYALCETLGWKGSLDDTPRKGRKLYIVLAVLTLGSLIIEVVGVKPMDALFWSAVINGLLAPPLLVLIMLIGNNRRIMGNRVNGTWLNAAGWLTTAAMFAAAIGLIVTWGQS
ncbi:MAG TPA: divalent metal cation transporter [Casimicrobiaceae bacterium]|nr:divalent metal cation transporter [Casimicrobiaceae bacterium]